MKKFLTFLALLILISLLNVGLVTAQTLNLADKFNAFELIASNTCSEEQKNQVVLAWSKPKDAKGKELTVKKFQLRYKIFTYPDNFSTEKSLQIFMKPLEIKLMLS